MKNVFITLEHNRQYYDWRYLNQLVPLIVDQTNLSLKKVPAPERISRHAKNMLQFATTNPDYSEEYYPTMIHKKIPKIGKMKTGQSYYVLKPNDLLKAKADDVMIELDINSLEDTVFESNLPIDVGI